VIVATCQDFSGKYRVNSIGAFVEYFQNGCTSIAIQSTSNGGTVTAPMAVITDGKYNKWCYGSDQDYRYTKLKAVNGRTTWVSKSTIVGDIKIGTLVKAYVGMTKIASHQSALQQANAGE
jgi:hypothetical protein